MSHGTVQRKPLSADPGPLIISEFSPPAFFGKHDLDNDSTFGQYHGGRRGVKRKPRYIVSGIRNVGTVRYRMSGEK